jgi:hypothetical protein
MLVYIDTASHINSHTCGGISKEQSIRFKSYELLKKLALDLEIGCNIQSMYMPSRWRRLPLPDQTGRVFIGIL